MSGNKRLDPAREQLWLDEQEAEALRYLQSQSRVVDGELQIEWCVAPIVANWRGTQPDGTAIWIISGDLPTDFVDDPSIRDPRDATRAFCTRWLEVADFLLQGKQHHAIQIGAGCTEVQLKELGDLLQRRAKVLQSWVDDDDKWCAGMA